MDERFQVTTIIINIVIIIGTRPLVGPRTRPAAQRRVHELGLANTSAFVLRGEGLPFRVVEIRVLVAVCRQREEVERLGAVGALGFDCADEVAGSGEIEEAAAGGVGGGVAGEDRGVFCVAGFGGGGFGGAGLGCRCCFCCLCCWGVGGC